MAPPTLVIGEEGLDEDRERSPEFLTVVAACTFFPLPHFEAGGDEAWDHDDWVECSGALLAECVAWPRGWVAVLAGVEH